MNYIELSPTNFEDENGVVSKDFLSQYCQIAPAKIRYNGNITVGNNEDSLVFKNIVYANFIGTYDIANQFPDLVSADILYYIVTEYSNLDIGNVSEVDRFNLRPLNVSDDPDHIEKYFKKNIKVIDGKTLIIKGKKLTVKKEWAAFMGSINSINYKSFGL